VHDGSLSDGYWCRSSVCSDEPETILKRLKGKKRLSATPQSLYALRGWPIARPRFKPAIAVSRNIEAPKAFRVEGSQLFSLPFSAKGEV